MVILHGTVLHNSGSGMDISSVYPVSVSMQDLTKLHVSRLQWTSALLAIVAIPLIIASALGAAGLIVEVGVELCALFLFLWIIECVCVAAHFLLKMCGVRRMIV